MPEHDIRPDDDPIPFFPKHFMTEFKVAMGMLVVAVIVGVLPFFRVELGEPANPMVTPVGIKPEWYFLAVYEVIKYIPKLAGTLLPFAIVGFLAVLPFIDRGPDTSRRQGQIRAVATAIVMVLFVVLTLLGRR
jgi:cytochrome b6-f complex subunit 4